jgi:hypothetical protein
VFFIRRTLSLAAIRAQSHSLLGRLEGLGRGVTAAMGSRKEALELERRWQKERKATDRGLVSKDEQVFLFCIAIQY